MAIPKNVALGGGGLGVLGTAITGTYFLTSNSNPEPKIIIAEQKYSLNHKKFDPKIIDFVNGKDGNFLDTEKSKLTFTKVEDSAEGKASIKLKSNVEFKIETEKWVKNSNDQANTAELKIEFKDLEENNNKYSWICKVEMEGNKIEKNYKFSPTQFESFTKKIGFSEDNNNKEITFTEDNKKNLKNFLNKCFESSLVGVGEKQITRKIVLKTKKDESSKTHEFEEFDKLT